MRNVGRAAQIGTSMPMPTGVRRPKIKRRHNLNYHTLKWRVNSTSIYHKIDCLASIVYKEEKRSIGFK